MDEYCFEDSNEEDEFMPSDEFDIGYFNRDPMIVDPPVNNESSNDEIFDDEGENYESDTFYEHLVNSKPDIIFPEFEENNVQSENDPPLPKANITGWKRKHRKHPPDFEDDFENKRMKLRNESNDEIDKLLVNPLCQLIINSRNANAIQKISGRRSLSQPEEGFFRPLDRMDAIPSSRDEKSVKPDFHSKRNSKEKRVYPLDLQMEWNEFQDVSSLYGSELKGMDLLQKHFRIVCKDANRKKKEKLNGTISDGVPTGKLEWMRRIEKILVGKKKKDHGAPPVIFVGFKAISSLVDKCKIPEFLIITAGTFLPYREAKSVKTTNELLLKLYGMLLKHNHTEIMFSSQLLNMTMKDRVNVNVTQKRVHGGKKLERDYSRECKMMNDHPILINLYKLFKERSQKSKAVDFKNFLVVAEIFLTRLFQLSEDWDFFDREKLKKLALGCYQWSKISTSYFSRK